jgi:hypothetical protein
MGLYIEVLEVKTRMPISTNIEVAFTMFAAKWMMHRL